MGVEPRRTSSVEAVNEFAERMAKTMEETRAALKHAAEDMARYYDANHREAGGFKVGDKVWLDGRNVKTVRPAKKLDDRWFGPFSIHKVVNRNAYHLKLPRNFRRVHPVFHVSLLRRWTPDSIIERPRPTRPEPEIAEDGKPEYEVEDILDSRIRYRKLQYLVRWKGYGPEENSWEPVDNLAGAPELISEFHEKHPSAAGRIAAAAFQSLMFYRYANLAKPDSSSGGVDSSRRRVLEGG